MRYSIDQWAAHLRATAEPPGFAPITATESLGTGPLDDPIMRACGLRIVPEGQPGVGDESGQSPEVLLWSMLARHRAGLAEDPRWHDAIDTIVSRATATGPGPLLEGSMFIAIEVWTDAELAALHALWWLGRTLNRHDWTKAVHSARDWHMEHTQPDNATNRPWAVHVFLEPESDEGAHYAQTLVHNALAIAGHPQPLARLLLQDAADALDAMRRGGEVNAEADRTTRP